MRPCHSATMRVPLGVSISITIRAPAASPTYCLSMPTRLWRQPAPDPERQKIVENLFRALTDINAEGNAIRRPQTLAKLLAVTGPDEETLKGHHRSLPRGRRLLPQTLRQYADRAGERGRHSPRGPDPLLAEDCGPEGRLAAAGVSRRPDLEIAQVAGSDGRDALGDSNGKPERMARDAAVTRLVRAICWRLGRRPAAEA